MAFPSNKLVTRFVITFVVTPLGLVASDRASAQDVVPTPWQSAPAAPAQLLPVPARQNTGMNNTAQQGTATPGGSQQPPAKRVVSLPPPPVSGSAVGAGPSTTTAPAKPAGATQGLMLPPLPVGPIERQQSSAPGIGGPQTSPATRPTTVANRHFTPSMGGPTSTVATNAGPGARPKAGMQALKPGELVAVVGTEHILAGDMSVFVEPIIEKNRDKIRSQQVEDQLRTQLTRQVLKQYIEIKAMYLEFFHDMVGNKPPSEIAEMREQVVTRATKIFYEKQVPTLYDRYEVNNTVDLERKLAEKSLSLITMKTQFIEQVLSAEYENKYIPRRFEISRRELLDYYRAQESEWNMQARVRWREITIRLDKHDETTAQNLIQNLYQQIYLGGKSFEAVAKQSSEGFTSEEGGVYEWTTLGSLKSKVIEQAIFTQPLKRLSPIIRDEVGLHIVEVLEREDAHVKSFPDAQTEIREIISRKKASEAKQKLRDKVLARTPIWTLWPEDLKDLPHVRELQGIVNI